VTMFAGLAVCLICGMFPLPILTEDLTSDVCPRCKERIVAVLKQNLKPPAKLFPVSMLPMSFLRLEADEPGGRFIERPIPEMAFADEALVPA